MSQAQLARRLDVAVQTVKRTEALGPSGTLPEWTLVEAWARATGADIIFDVRRRR